jgi:hypothetical protein
LTVGLVFTSYRRYSAKRGGRVLNSDRFGDGAGMCGSLDPGGKVQDDDAQHADLTRRDGVASAVIGR